MTKLPQGNSFPGGFSNISLPEIQQGGFASREEAPSIGLDRPQEDKEGATISIEIPGEIQQPSQPVTNPPPSSDLDLASVDKL